MWGVCVYVCVCVCVYFLIVFVCVVCDPCDSFLFTYLIKLQKGTKIVRADQHKERHTHAHRSEFIKRAIMCPT